MNHWIYSFAAFFLCLVAGALTVFAEDWVQGSVAVFAIEEGVDLFEMGQGDLAVSFNEVPTYIPGLLIAKSSLSSRVSMLASNGVFMDFKGAGYFSIERFEQEVLDEQWLEAKQESGQSRMITSLRAGTLIVDQRKLLDASQAILETPVGRLSGGSHALWMIELDKDVRKRTYSFNVFCLQGALRFFDLGGRTYTISAGQRISGAGSAQTPSVEVAEITSDAQEYFDDYLDKVSSISQLGVTEDGFRSATKRLESDSGVEVSNTLPKAQKNEARPVVIEYAPRSAPVTPFKGVARPPSDYQADLF